MLKKILKSCYLFLTVIFAASSTLFAVIAPVNAEQMSSINIDENSTEISLEESVNSSDASINSEAPDLGDDQAFPFIPGFGKNSGKD